MPPKKLTLTSTGQYKLSIPKSTYKAPKKDYSEPPHIQQIRKDNDYVCYYKFPGSNAYVLDKYGVSENEIIDYVLDKWPELAQTTLL